LWGCEPSSQASSLNGFGVQGGAKACFCVSGRLPDRPKRDYSAGVRARLVVAGAPRSGLSIESLPIGVIQAAQQIAVGLFVIVMMGAAGLDLRLADLWEVVRKPRALILAVLLNYVAIPLAALIAVRLANLDPAHAVGVLLVAVSPGGPVGAPLAQRGGGHLALAVAIVVVTNILNTIATPGLAHILGIMPDIGGSTPLAAMFLTILVYQLIPLAIAIWLRERRPALADRIRGPVSRLSQLALAIGAAALTFAGGGKLLDAPFKLVVVIIVLVGLSLGLGWLAAWKDRPRQVSLSITSAFRNMSLVMLLVAAWFPEFETLLAAVLFSGLMFGACSVASLIAARSAPLRTNGVSG
jgi:BASS family bile acid:Na+ symporter